ncbi:Uncharacterised protein [Bordetella hinzii]|uniref:peptidase M14 n=1 Tax=Bordetella hinzii TaxID=103855 RepID=UPI000427703F|nr:peptidase M14 [Bordetella hinzii]AKQ54770.1 hypothetical protein ACR54_01436 [Bordetella hinzii]KCB30219.1 hypothetical protein L541_2709 [Bordetella hinzii CA90 BAL1384]KCB31107.1 hypothetical protein L543_2660 [Bordetella hinzii L60]KCB50756.1 hypothetical protein L537_2805 [Bordetella hinzii 1277]QII84581.1 peptidase M14 [Bordetella hinzii]
MILLETTFARLADTWLERYARPRWQGCRLEGWLFEGLAARRQLEAALAEAGVTARIRSAYKPLVHAFLEDIEAQDVIRAEIRYPVLAGVAPDRFLLEAYPLADLLPGVRFLPQAPQDGPAVYTAVLHRRSGAVQTCRIEAPNTWSRDRQGLSALSPSAWLRLAGPDGACLLDQAERAEYRQIFDAAMDTLAAHPWGQAEPYFERLSLRVDIPPLETPLPGGETASSCEALHEDLYFSALEFFQRHSGRPLGDRGLRPGQIVPDVRHGTVPRLIIATESFAPVAPLTPRAAALATRGHPLTLDEVAHSLAALGGQANEAPTRQGRRILWHYCPSALPAAPVLISAAQHANETSGVVGALRAAGQLLGQGPFALIPVENPDGYALFEALRAIHPNHMHHAARYSALGDDVAYREGPPAAESLARHQALVQSGARLHINLHGYPSHEWTRPLSGYLPRGFESWTLPKGFFLILRYHPGWEEQARRLAQAATARLALAMPDLADFNAAQQARRAAYAATEDWPVFNGVPVLLGESTRELASLALTAEFPDETVYGADYVFAHTVHMHTVLSAAAAWREIAA